MLLLLLFIATGLFSIIPSNLQANQKLLSTLCPSGYWPATVNYSGGPYGTDRTFELPYQNSNTTDDYKPICNYCPNVGCYIVRLSKSDVDENEHLNAMWRSTTAEPTTTTMNPDANFDFMMGWEQDDLFLDNSNITDNLDVNNSSKNATVDEKENLEEENAIYMSCDTWDNLPNPESIVSYLDCVMIGDENKYYLFIYEPRFVSKRLPTVDCVDANFLAWIPNNTDILGLELGFRMKTIPPFLFRYYQRIMQLTQYICIDGSGLTNNSIDFRDVERFASNKLTQVVFRSKSLHRGRKPPKAPDEHHTTNFQSEEVIEMCPFIVQQRPANITADVDCQFSPGALPTTSDEVNVDEALNRCPFHYHRSIKSKNSKSNQKQLSLTERLNLSPSVLSACLLIVVLTLTFGIIIGFCALNHKRLMLFQSRKSKRRAREAALAIELAEQAAKDAANAALEAQQNAMKHPLYGRYGMIPPSMRF